MNRRRIQACAVQICDFTIQNYNSEKRINYMYSLQCKTHDYFYDNFFL